jgi:hypothetical protein
MRVNILKLFKHRLQIIHLVKKIEREKKRKLFIFLMRQKIKGETNKDEKQKQITFQ